MFDDNEMQNTKKPINTASQMDMCNRLNENFESRYTEY